MFTGFWYILTANHGCVNARVHAIVRVCLNELALWAADAVAFAVAMDGVAVRVKA